jgi:heme exporter protein A
MRLMRLSAEALAAVRGGRQVFAGVEFSLGAGEVLAVTGANGSGKSTLLRLIAGLVPPAGGTLRLDGGEADRTLPEQAHYLGHQDALKTSLTVAENLSFWQRYLGGGGAALAAALETVGLAAIADLPAAYLSAGQRRRLSLARLIAVKRPIWLLDEPTSALDEAGQRLLSGLMRRHLDGGGLLIAATHGPLGLEATHALQLGAPA